MTNSKKAIILFTDNPSADAERKSTNKVQTSILAERFKGYVNQLETDCRNSDIQLIISSPDIGFREKTTSQFHLQQEGSFAKRMYSAISFAFERGFNKIVIVGNDTFSLQFSEIYKSLEITVEGKVNIGPSSDGGFYLMSICKNDFDKIQFSQFIKLAFNTSSICYELLNLLASINIICSTLNIKTDVDDFNTFIRLYRNSIALRIYTLIIIQRLLQISNAYNASINNFTKTNSFQLRTRKAPPTII